MQKDNIDTKNTTVIGNMGQGKSCTSNRIAHVINNPQKPRDSKVKQIFESKSATNSVTKETTSQLIKCLNNNIKINVTDTRGLNEANVSN